MHIKKKIPILPLQFSSLRWRSLEIVDFYFFAVIFECVMACESWIMNDLARALLRAWVTNSGSRALPVQQPAMHPNTAVRLLFCVCLCMWFLLYINKYTIYMALICLPYKVCDSFGKLSDNVEINCCYNLFNKKIRISTDHEKWDSARKAQNALWDETEAKFS